jgi:hypothetical protein
VNSVSVSGKSLKCLLINLSQEGESLGIRADAHGTVLDVDVEYRSGDKLAFKMSRVPEVADTEVVVGPASEIVGFVLKYGQEKPELQVIYANEKTGPLMCCICGPVRVCANWCGCG